MSISVIWNCVFIEFVQCRVSWPFDHVPSHSGKAARIINHRSPEQILKWATGANHHVLPQAPWKYSNWATSAFPTGIMRRLSNFWSERRAIAKAKATSDAIDVQIEEDIRTLRKQVKVLLLGEVLHTLFLTRFWSMTRLYIAVSEFLMCIVSRRKRFRKVDYRKTNDNHSPGWIFSRRVDVISSCHLSQYSFKRPINYRDNASDWSRFWTTRKQGI